MSTTTILPIVVLLGFCLILFLLTSLKHFLRRKNNPHYDESTRTYMTEGMIIGVLLGGVLGLIINKEQLPMFIIPCMMIGLVLGAMVKGK